MLVLTRKPNQQLKIGNDIVITVVKVRGNTIRLGIEAPRDVRVIRSELEGKPENSPESSVIIAEISIDVEPNAIDHVVDGEKNVPAKSLGQSMTTNSSSSKRPPLKAFTQAKAHDSYAGRNLEDSPLCHCSADAPRAVRSDRSVKRENSNDLLNQRGPLSQRVPLSKSSAKSFALFSHS